MCKYFWCDIYLIAMKCLLLLKKLSCRPKRLKVFFHILKIHGHLQLFLSSQFLLQRGEHAEHINSIRSAIYLELKFLSDTTWLSLQCSDIMSARKHWLMISLFHLWETLLQVLLETSSLPSSLSEQIIFARYLKVSGCAIFTSS